MGQLAERLIRFTLWSLVLASIAGFWLITFVRPSRWYRDTPRHGAFFTRWNMDYNGTKRTVGSEAAFLYGLWLAQIVFQWLPNVSAVIFAALLMMYNRHRRRAVEKQQRHAEPSTGRAVQVWFKRVLSYQLPPRGFWSYWCDGLSVLDLLLVLFYLGLNIAWLYETYKRTFKGVDAQVAAGKLSGREKTQAYTAEAGTTWGWVSVVDLLLVFYPVSRSSFLHWITGTDFPKLIRYHRWMSHGLMWVLLMHALLFYAVWWDQGVWVQETFHWNEYIINNLAGSIAWVISVFIWFGSFNWVRRKYFELFYAFHVYGVPLFMVFSLMHYKYLVIYMLPGLILYLLDLTFRFWQLNTDVSTATVSVVSEESRIVAIDLFFTHNAEVPPASFLFLHFPTLTKLQRHAFTIAEVHRDPSTGTQRAVVYVKVPATGRGWSAQLFSAAQRSEGGTCQMPVSIDGPYGSGHTLGDRALEAAVFVAGGIGATPAVSILLDLVRRRAAGLTVPGRLHLVWTAKSADEFEAMMPQEVLDAAASGWLTVSLHTTGAAAGKQDKSGVCTAKFSAPAVKPASAPTTGLLLGFDRSYWAYCLGTIFAFFGAFAGLLPAAAYDAHAGKTTTTGAWYSAVGVIQFIAIPLGAMVPPLLLVVLPNYFYRLHRSKQPMQQGSGSDSPSAAAHVAPEGGKLVSSTLPGRPDLLRALADVQSKYSSAAEIPVVAAGPSSMIHDVRDACHQLNRGGAPFLDFQPHTFLL